MKINGILPDLNKSAINATSNLTELSKEIDNSKKLINDKLETALEMKKVLNRKVVNSVLIDPISDMMQALKRILNDSANKAKNYRLIGKMEKSEIKELKGGKKILKHDQKAVRRAYRQREVFTEVDNARIETEGLINGLIKKEQLDVAHSLRQATFQTQAELEGIKAEKAALQARLAELNIQEKDTTQGLSMLKKMAQEAAKQVDTE